MNVELKGVSRIFERTGTGLSETQLTFNRGEWVTLLGPSGCGKSTLLRMVAGLETLTSGELIQPVAREELAFVFQDPALLPWLTVTENVSLPLRLRGVSRSEAEARAHKELARLRILNHKQSKPHELSGGIKMRVSLARALVTEPKLLLLDEPFAALDEPIRIELGLELRELFRLLQPTIIMVTHSITEALWLSDRVVVFQGQPGKVVLDEPIELGPHRELSQRGDSRFLDRVERCFQLLKGGRL